MDVEQEQGMDLASFAIGGCTPRHVHTPENVEALAGTLRTIREHGESVVFFGGGTLQCVGNPPTRYNVAVSLAALNKPIVHAFQDLTIAVQAGMTLSTLTRTLSEHNQFIPLDAPRPTHGTVGGTLASGWAGPRRATYGRPRDF